MFVGLSSVRNRACFGLEKVRLLFGNSRECDEPKIHF